MERLLCWGTGTFPLRSAFHANTTQGPRLVRLYQDYTRKCGNLAPGQLWVALFFSV